jgi:chorismate--pyruvate lyase
MTTWQTTLPDNLDPLLEKLITSTGSLTVLMRELAKEKFHLELIDEHFATATAEHAALLNLPSDKQCKQRQVKLHIDGKAIAIGYTVIGTDDLETIGKALKELGERSLGDLLFSDSSVERSRLQFALLKPDDELYRLAKPYIEDKKQQQPAWARRSVFTFRGAKLLVHEIFLI